MVFSAIWISCLRLGAIGFAKTKDKGIPALTGFLAIATLKKGWRL